LVTDDTIYFQFRAYVIINTFKINYKLIIVIIELFLDNYTSKCCGIVLLVMLSFLEVDKCEPNPCHNNATCINDGIGFKCICPFATEPDTAIVGVLCNECKNLHCIFAAL